MTGNICMYFLLQMYQYPVSCILLENLEHVDSIYMYLLNFFMHKALTFQVFNAFDGTKPSTNIFELLNYANPGFGSLNERYV